MTLPLSGGPGQPTPLLSGCRDLPWWPAAVSNLQALWVAGGTAAQEKAAGYSKAYAADRASMVVDVVTSRRRRYDTHVAGLVQEFRGARVTTLAGLAGLSKLPVGGLRVGEDSTILGVASGLLAWNARRSAPIGNDEDLVADWAEWATPFDLAPRLDAWVGSVKGIGPALYTYLRMRSGGDGIKPDVRVRGRLAGLGFMVPPGDQGLLILAWAAAEELGIQRIELDQLLW